MKTKFSRFLTLLLAFVVHISVAQEKTSRVSLLMLPASHFLELIYLSKEVKMVHRLILTVNIPLKPQSETFLFLLTLVKKQLSAQLDHPTLSMFK